MRSNLRFFKGAKYLSADKFFQKVLYDKKIGYYSSKFPFGINGDFITAPKISRIFSEIISIWLISIWESYGKPKNFNIIELGPGDGSLIKILLEVSNKFPDFNAAKKIYLYEISDYLINLQKRNINNKNINWIKNFNSIKKGPVVFFGNEFLDAIPIKQFKRKKDYLFEKYFYLKKNFKVEETFKKAFAFDNKKVNSYKTLKNLRFIEFPKIGFVELKKIIRKILKQNGCILLFDYGYLKPNNQNTLQSVFKHKKNDLMKNLGKADITSHVNFKLLEEFFLKNNLKVKNILTQSQFLKNMGILERAELLSKNMRFNDKTNMYLRVKRLLDKRLMGELFKVILAFKSKKNNYFGFD